MDQTRREYHANRPAPVRGPGRHHAPPGPSLRARRVVAAVAVGLAVGSAAIGAARGDGGPLSGEAPAVATEPTPPSATPSERRPSPTPVRSASAAQTPPKSPSTTPSTSGATQSAAAAGATTAKRSTPTVLTRGNGTLVPVLVPGADSTGSGRVVTYAFEVEDGLGIDREQAAETVGSTLRDARGWQSVDGVRFVQVTPKQRAGGTRPDVTISLVSPDKTDRMCAPLKTEGTWSCANKDHAVLNYRRWMLSTPSYSAMSRQDYRSYLVNHEVGHELSHGHVGCPTKGKPAPVMMQQSMGLDGCRPNVWPKVTRG